MKVEVYFGWYEGDAQFWDTEYVEIPDKTPENEIEEVARDAFRATYLSIMEIKDLAFTGLFCVCEDDPDYEDDVFYGPS